MSRPQQASQHMASEMNLQQSDLTQVTPHTADGSNDIAVEGSESDEEHENGQVRG